MQIQLPAASPIDRSFDVCLANYPHLRELLGRLPKKGTLFSETGSDLGGEVEAARALRFLGIKEWSEGRLEAAARLLLAAAKLTPDAALIWSDLGGVYYAMSRLEEARICTSVSLDNDSTQPSAWLLLGTIHSDALNGAGAEAAFLTALQLDPHLAPAFVGLGLLYFRQRRFKEAADRLKAALWLGNQVPLVNACLGQALYFLGDFAGAGDAFAIEASLHPCDTKIQRKFALVRFVDAIIRDGVQTALPVYRKIAGPHAEDLATVTQTAFHLLSGYGHRDAAIKLGQARLASAPDDPIQSYLLAALAQEPLSRAPENYIVGYFDLFAETFDAQLVDVLGYSVPEDLHGLLAETRRTFPHVLDLGCGTGLAGPLLHSFAGTLIGIDLSRKMLEKAADKSVYDHLIEGDFLVFLDHQPECFDLIFAADVLVYFGDLAQLLKSAAQSLKPGGLFAFSIECTHEADYTILPSGRFAHGASYIEDLARDHFTLVRAVPRTIRLEAGLPAEGILYMLGRR